VNYRGTNHYATDFFMAEGHGYYAFDHRWVVPESPGVTAQTFDCGVSFESRHLVFQPGARREIIGIHAGDPFRGGVAETNTQRASLTKILFQAQQFDPVIVVRANHLSGLVGRCVVDDQKSEIGIRLSKDAINGHLQIWDTVSDGH
jgi:hypothetical protein